MNKLFNIKTIIALLLLSSSFSAFASNDYQILNKKVIDTSKVVNSSNIALHNKESFKRKDNDKKIYDKRDNDKRYNESEWNSNDSKEWRERDREWRERDREWRERDREWRERDREWRDREWRDKERRDKGWRERDGRIHNEPYIQFVEISPEDFASLCQLIRKQSFDEGKIDIIKACCIAPFFSFSVQQCKKILDMMSFDDAKISTLEILSPKIVIRENLSTIIDSFSFGSNKEKAMKILMR